MFGSPCRFSSIFTKVPKNAAEKTTVDLSSCDFGLPLTVFLAEILAKQAFWQAGEYGAQVKGTAWSRENGKKRSGSST